MYGIIYTNEIYDNNFKKHIEDNVTILRKNWNKHNTIER